MIQSRAVTEGRAGYPPPRLGNAAEVSRGARTRRTTSAANGHASPSTPSAGGPLAHALAHPRYEVDKVYEVEVEGEPSDEALEALRRGVELDDGPTAPAEAQRRAPSRLELTLHEGRKHQVKRMLAAVGHPVTRLHRSSYAGLTADGLRPGEWRELTLEEVERLRAPRAP